MEKAKQAAVMYFLDWVSSKGGVNATDRIAAMFKCVTAYWLTNIKIADLKNVMSPFFEVSRGQEQDEAKDYFVLAVFSLGGEGVGFL